MNIIKLQGKAGFPSLPGARMSLGKEPLEPITADDQVAPVAADEILLLEPNKEFSYSWSRSTQ
jgi:hypothetical protein